MNTERVPPEVPAILDLVGALHAGDGIDDEAGLMHAAAMEIRRLREALARVVGHCEVAWAKADDAPCSAETHCWEASREACRALGGPWEPDGSGFVCGLRRRLEDEIASGLQRQEGLIDMLRWALNRDSGWCGVRSPCAACDPCPSLLRCQTAWALVRGA